MFKLNFKKMGIISILLLLFVSISCVCAQDVGVNSTNSDISDLNQESSLDVSDNASGSFSELNNDLSNLSSGDTYNFNKDYYYNSTIDGAFFDGICINASNIVINGNNHVISGNNISAIFKVYGNNVNIYNLTFADSYGIRESFDNYIAANTIAPYYDSFSGKFRSDPVSDRINAELEAKAKKIFGHGGSLSPVTWYGNNGVISNCAFMSNTAVNGGALTWKGNNGTVRNVNFVNNTARGIGGSIYIIGQNNIIDSCNFINSFSRLSFEAIFFDYKTAGNTITGNISISDNGILAIDCITPLDTDCFYKPVMYEIYSNVYINLVDYAYRSWITAGNAYDENSLTYSGVFGNGSFKLNFNKFYKNYDMKYEYQDQSTGGMDIRAPVLALRGDFNHLRILNFNNITCIDDAINSLYARHYNVEDVVLANYTFSGKYLSTLNTLSFKDGILGSIVPQSVTYVLNINFPAGKTYDFNSQLNIPKKYDVVNIIGNGIKIAADSDLRDENHLLVLDDDVVCTFNNLTISGFNTALRLNNGITICNYVVFDSNKLDYRIDKDWGGAILNLAVCFCNNCTFINNYAQNGGAIFNAGVLYVDNATVFDNNYAKSNGNTILNVDKGLCYMDNIQINGNTDNVRYVSSFSKLANGLIAAGSIVLSFVAGFVAGFFGGPAVGIIVGVVVGAALGTTSYKIIDNHNFDVHFNRVFWGCLCIGGSIIAGAVGGAIGGAVHNALSAKAMAELAPEAQNIADSPVGHAGGAFARGSAIDMAPGFGPGGADAEVIQYGIYEGPARATCRVVSIGAPIVGTGT